MSKGEIIINLLSNENKFDNESFLDYKKFSNSWLYFAFLYISHIEKTIDYLKENQVDDLLVKIDALEDRKAKFCEIIGFELKCHNED